jgi:hypothetical protein
MRIRPMRVDDLDRLPRGPAPLAGPPDHAYAGLVDAATTHLLKHDPGGCWVADDGHALRGLAVAARRDLLWILARFAVDDDTSPGVTRALLSAAVDYGSGCLRGWTSAPAAADTVGVLRGAAFDLHPTLRLTGVVDRSTLPVVDGVRTGSAGDLEFADSVDRQVRGAAHGPDHAVLLARAALLTCDLLTGRGYAYVRDGVVEALAATNRSVGQRLLWSALATAPAGRSVDVRFLTPAHGWALDVGLAAGLHAAAGGILAVRHARPAEFHLPSPVFG